MDWYPWGEEAFSAAKEKDLPIFLSIGYATCHWCHAMEKESFENEKVAELLNSTFINIKVDREELPEVDALYMDFAQSMMAGAAGWPLNVILTPELEPFFAATYLPPESRQGMMGLVDLIHRIDEVWKGEEREKIEEQATRIVEVFQENIPKTSPDLPTKEQVKLSGEVYFKIADPIYGGLKGAPKFPVGYQYNFLLSFYQTTKDSRALFLVERTLDMLLRGGIYDHIGGGFSRYSVDERWMIPHFEKMLYDNALLVSTYTAAAKCTKKGVFREVACDVCNWMLREMCHPEGGFYSAIDADSEGVEGKFYTWSYNELESVLGISLFEIFRDAYGVTREGNFQAENQLYLPLGIEEFANKHKFNPEYVQGELAKAKKILFEVREKRVHPFKDDKIITSWNGLAISALVEAGRAFDNPLYIEAAKKCADFIKTYLWDRKTLKRRFRLGEVSHRGTLDDYVFLIRGFLSLFEAGEGMQYLVDAIDLAKTVDELFLCPDGGYYQSDGKDPSIIIRTLRYSDGAEPSGNAVHAENLLRLYQITRQQDYLSQAEGIFRGIKKYLDQFSPGYFYHVMNLCRYFDIHKKTYVLAFNESSDQKTASLKIFGQKFDPFGVFVPIDFKDQKMAKTLFEMEHYPLVDGKTTLYICDETGCSLPISDRMGIIDALEA